jgi:prevent-host-death family protein
MPSFTSFATHTLSFVCVHLVVIACSMRSTTTRALRENLRATIATAARGEEVLVTLRGKPYVRIVPASPRAPKGSGSYPLRGSAVRMADDFDAPLDRLWKALGE